ncbi:unnamed protein product [Sphagnum jensenii]|uniref:Zinc knuckle CX2CX4HX4C domain-containing protein n=1 Tax=Sphagnum jensenii TaxID=128206 RepID=A0ABP0X058_9BRYO
MASKLGEVLDIEAVDSYMKRPAGPMVTIEVREISKLARYIRIPSMAEGASATDTIRQRILYLGLPNQCRKCCKFEHHTRICNTNRFKPQEVLVHHSAPPPPPRANAGRAPNSRPPPQSATRASKSGPPTEAPPDSQTMGSGATHVEAKISMNCPPAPTQSISVIKPLIDNLMLGPDQWTSTSDDQKDQDMTELSKSPTRAKNKTRPEAERFTEGVFTPKVKLCFGIPGLISLQALAPEANANPFASLGEGNREAELCNKPHEDALER